MFSNHSGCGDCGPYLSRARESVTASCSRISSTMEVYHFRRQIVIISRSTGRQLGRTLFLLYRELRSVLRPCTQSVHCVSLISVTGCTNCSNLYTFVRCTWIDRLSAHLYEITSNRAYLSSAVSAANFVLSHMNFRGAILGAIRLSSSASGPQTNCSSLNRYPYSHVTGYAIWGLAVLGSHHDVYGSR